MSGDVPSPRYGHTATYISDINPPSETPVYIEEEEDEDDEDDDDDDDDEDADANDNNENEKNVFQTHRSTPSQSKTSNSNVYASYDDTSSTTSF